MKGKITKEYVLVVINSMGYIEDDFFGEYSIRNTTDGYFTFNHLFSKITFTTPSIDELNGIKTLNEFVNYVNKVVEKEDRNKQKLKVLSNKRAEKQQKENKQLGIEGEMEL